MSNATHDRIRTQEIILTNALAEFAAKGFDGARVDSIAKRSALSKNMLYHYFGSKEGLFIAVLERAYETLWASHGEISVEMLTPPQALCVIITHTFQALVKFPEVIAILNSENLHRGDHLRHLKHNRELRNPLVDMICEVVDRGQKQGIFRSDIDPIILYISIVCLSGHYNSNQYTLQHVLNIDLASDERRSAWLAHISRMIISFCTDLVILEANPGERTCACHAEEKAQPAVI